MPTPAGPVLSRVLACVWGVRICCQKMGGGVSPDVLHSPVRDQQGGPNWKVLRRANPAQTVCVFDDDGLPGRCNHTVPETQPAWFHVTALENILAGGDQPGADPDHESFGHVGPAGPLVLSTEEVIGIPDRPDSGQQAEEHQGGVLAPQLTARNQD